MVVDVSPEVLVALGAVLTVLMQVLKWLNVINETTSDGVQRIAAGVLAGIAVVVANYTVFLSVDWANPVTAVLSLAGVAGELWLMATGIYHLLYKPAAKLLNK
jgi:hypothetical protein